MNMRTTIFLVAAVSLYAHSTIACEWPADFNVPDGLRATEAEMTAAGQSYTRFMADLQRYQECLEIEADQIRQSSESRGKQDIEQFEDLFSAQYNDASSAMTQATEQFNKAIADYKSR